MYIVIEGVDGSGKTTHARILAEHLNAVHVVEPTSGPIGKLIRERIGQGELNPAVMARLFAADRHDLAERVIVPALAEGKIVVSDRNLVSSLVYQPEGDLTAEAVWDINTKGRDLPTPDLVVVIQVSLEISMARLRDSRGHTDAFETQERMHKHISRYERLGDFVRWPVTYVDGDAPREIVARRVLDAVEGLPAR